MKKTFVNLILVVLAAFAGSHLFHATPTPAEAAYSTQAAPTLGFRNKIINGDFDFWQRGTSIVASNGTYGPDRYSLLQGGAAGWTMIRSTDVPTVAQSDNFSSYSLYMDCTAADGVLGSGDYSAVRYVIEGYDFSEIAQKPFTISFWVKATVTGVYCVAFNNSGTDRYWIGTYIVNATQTWEKKTIYVPASPSAGTWDYANGAGAYVTFALSVNQIQPIGTGTHNSASWNTSASGTIISSTSQVNAASSTANEWRISQIQVEPNHVTPSFSKKPYLTELEMCQRYCFALNSGAGMNLLGDKWAVNRIMFQVPLPTTMRTSMTWNNGTAGSPTWAAGSPTGNQFAFYSWSDGGYVTISGALTVLTYSSSPYSQVIMELNAATSFSGTVSATGLAQCASGVTGFLTAEY